MSVSSVIFNPTSSRGHVLDSLLQTKLQTQIMCMESLSSCSPSRYQYLPLQGLHGHNRNLLTILPSCLIHEILLFLPALESSLNISLVCHQFNELSRDNFIWSSTYLTRFGDTGDVADAGLTYKCRYEMRLKNPLVGDRLQVCWTGQFVLAQVGPYRGTAWWEAEIVAKDPEKDLFQVCYIGWQHNWNEWTPRSRLRWHGKSDGQSDLIEPNSRVELKVLGRSCFAWLECSVSQVLPSSSSNSELYVIKDAMLNEELTVPRDRLKLAQQPQVKLVK